ncbi:MAG: 2-C-methyl-D-erythritol 4-phosphate cytidylyltransferase [Ruminococcus flavefaciens]|nr:2-C-methyl-D-erythritol 4-phosphate cytidylyltransferase [Roseburia sp.]MCM1231433.1 2-C-methyl-D-erythritol 4-phosphate cytidylyltransferase [Ruminococcus flavefaciens]
MNIAMIIAGGKGIRTHQDIPKQFLSVHDRPVIVYTMQAFQKHPEIDAILVVCIEGWQEILWAYARQFNISKMKWVVAGGENGQQSIHNGIVELDKYCEPSDLVLVHDAIRPNVSQEIISNCIAECRLHGSAVAVIPCAEAMLLRNEDPNSSSAMISRNMLARTQTPQAFSMQKLIWAHKEAEKQGIGNSIATCTLMVELGEEVYFCPGSEKNIKITTAEDLEIFKALLLAGKDEWLK